MRNKFTFEDICNQIIDNLHKVDGYSLEQIYWHVFGKTITYNETNNLFINNSCPVFKTVNFTKESLPERVKLIKKMEQSEIP